MTKSILATALLIAASGVLLSLDLPSPWIKRGSHPDKYEMGIAKGAGQNSSNAATIRSIEKNIDGFGTLMQNILPGKYSGKRVRMSGFMKSTDVAEWAGFWMRVDRVNTALEGDSISASTLSFDNMEDRAIKGTTDWKKYQVVLDVPANATRIAFGALLAGTGQIWFDNVKFEIVDKSIPATQASEEIDAGKMEKKLYNSFAVSREPGNLNFEK
jgi:hypothetical protein